MKKRSFLKSKLIRRQGLFIALGIWLLLLQVSPGHSGQYRKGLSSTVPKQTITADSLDKETGLVIAPGYKLVKTNCIRCHSPQLITGKRATRDGWLATIRWMQQNQGLWDLGKAEPEILNYLATHYAPAARGRRPILKDVQWYKL